MNRRSLFTLAIAVAMMTGCSLASDTKDETSQDQTASTASALQDDGDDGSEGPGPNVFTLSLNSDGFLTGVNASGATLSATFTSATKYRAANLNQFIPADPIRPALIAYNAAVGGPHELLTGAIANLGAAHVHARLSIKNGDIKSFRPVRGTTTF